MFIKKIGVMPNYKGIVYKNNKLEKVLDSGVAYFFRVPFVTNLSFVQISTLPKTIIVKNQDVLTKDTINVKFSYYIIYKIVDYIKFAQNVNVFKVNAFTQNEVEERLHLSSQVHLRDVVGQLTADEINEKRNTIFEGALQKLQTEFNDSGIELTTLVVRDITFSKKLKDVFEKELEAKLKGKVELENARTQIATARALINAANLIKDNPEIKTLKYLEALKEAVQNKGNTLVFGDIPNTIKNPS